MTRALITGASQGLGAAFAAHLARPGGVVGLVSRRQEALDAVARRVEAAGARAIVLVADVADTAAMAAAVRAFEAEAGGIDLAIANAGVGVADTVAAGDAAPVARAIATNLGGVANTLIPCVPGMVARGGGALVAVGSFAGLRGLPGRAGYSASKRGVEALVDALRAQLRGTGVHAMTLAPGYVATPMTARLGHGLPFLTTPEVVCAALDRGLRRRARRVITPWQMAWLAPLWVRLPEAWLPRLVGPGPTDDSTPPTEGA